MNRLAIAGKRLKPCPFCGHTEQGLGTDDGYRWYFVECSGCGARGPEERGMKTPVESWNKREVSDE